MSTFVRLFVDCDDTLVKWVGLFNDDGTPTGREEPQCNHELSRAMSKWYLDRYAAFMADPDNTPDPRIYVWSGGGREYAAKWALEYVPFLYHAAVSKDITIPLQGDICIDDEPIRPRNEGVTVMTAEEFIAQHG